MLTGVLLISFIFSFEFLPAINNPSEMETYRRAGKCQKAYEVTSFCCLKKVPYESSGITSAQTWLLKSVCGNASATFLGSPYIFWTLDEEFHVALEVGIQHPHSPKICLKYSFSEGIWCQVLNIQMVIIDRKSLHTFCSFFLKIH